MSKSMKNPKMEERYFQTNVAGDGRCRRRHGRPWKAPTHRASVIVHHQLSTAWTRESVTLLYSVLNWNC
ncbi:hypothetical protein MTR_8g080550 [Medicago truncatula]|uniref:Uncharacterized protein n=1 Tax=Medicago truncatula TaxID=3880 RepID=A0A072TT44_MEDTR|nr:hypothetical protein MTR_8g080550 [Medicago truncatula]